jgi:hypothetical protein
MELAAPQFASARPHLAGLFQQVLTVDANFVATATVNDSDCTLSGLPSGKTVRVQIVSANDAGEAQASSVAEIVVT